MPSVDNRVVRMEFDNAAFEKKLESTIASLDKLNKSLQLEGASKGLSQVNSEAGKFNLGTIGSAIEDVSSKFLGFATIGITALANLTTAAMHAGGQIAIALTAPIRDGFQEYETNLNSIQTILANTASKGTSMDQVTGALDKLNEYSDKTIYNFGQMAKNIGTFTAAGVDLDSSVNSIKGIANLAAMSGSNADQASSAMYQLSQAMAAGKIAAVDWQSVVTSGMAGEVFQNGLYQSAKAMGTLKDVPLDQSFAEWKEGGGNFKAAMADGVFTADVLSTTLQSFTGDLSDAQLAEKGFSEQQIADMQATAKTAQAAATEVKTFTQMIGTVKEAIGTGFADSFKIIVGDFGEAKHTWTALNTGITDFVQKNAKARNALLQGWKDLGGRAQLIEGFHSAISNLATIIGTVYKAFRDIFPPKTAQDLMNMTNSFVKFTKALQPSQQTIENITSIAHGFFSVLKIGWTILKEGVKFISELFQSLSGAGSGKFLELAGNVGDFFTNLSKGLIDGGGIHAFFEKLYDGAQKAIGVIKDVADKIAEFFAKLHPEKTEATNDSLEKTTDRFKILKDTIDKLKDIWNGFTDGTKKVDAVLKEVWDALWGFFSGIGKRLGDIISSENWDPALDGIKTGLLGGITLLIYKFFKEGFKFDIGSGLFGKIKESFEELTGVLSAMQTSIKADALLKIAGAIALLTASVVVLSMIDSDALAKALTAMAVGFGELMGAFAIINQINSGVKGAASFDMIAIGMGIMSTSILILAASAKVLGDMSWDEIGKGILGISALMAILIISAKQLEEDEGGMLKAAGTMVIMSYALGRLVDVVERLGGMSLAVMAQGLVGVSIALLIIGTAMKKMPKGMEKSGAGLLITAKALDFMVAAIQKFADMNIYDIAKGLIVIAIALDVIGGGMQKMPPNMLELAFALGVTAISLKLIASAIGDMAAMSIFELAKGLIAMSIALSIISGAANAMIEAIPGAIAIGIMAISLLILAKAIQAFADMGLGTVIVGMLGLIVVIAGLAGAAMLLAPALPFMLALGVALAFIGVGMVLFGAGALMVANAFFVMSKAGEKGAEALTASLMAIGAALPTLAAGFAKGILEIIEILLDAAPMIIGKLLEIGGALILGLAGLLPKLGQLLIAAVTTLLTVLVTLYPRFIEAGIQLILSLLGGIRDHIGELVTIVGEIIVNFLTALTGQLPRIIEAGVNLIVSLIQGIAESNVKITAAVVEMILTFLKGITDNLSLILAAGTDMLIQLLKGISDSLSKITTAVTEIITRFINEMDQNVQIIIDAGAKFVEDLITGIGQKAEDVVTAGRKTLESFLRGIANNIVALADSSFQLVTDLLNALAAVIRTRGDELREAGMNLAGAIIDGMTGGLASRAKEVADKAVGVVQDGYHAAKNWLKVVGDPYSLKFMGVAEAMMNGMSMGLDADTSVERSAIGVVQRTAAAFEDTFAIMTASLGEMEEFNPTITPVLDLTRVAADAAQISGYIQTSQKLAPNYSYAQARTIASSANAQQDDAVIAPAGSGAVTFNQTINSPTQLSTTDIYRNTRNQITLAKQELSIP